MNPADQRKHHLNGDPHTRGRWLSDLILGAQDGVVNTLGVVLGVASATADTRIILATGLAAAFAESISMAAVAYTSSVARGDLYRAERAREYRHVEATPDVEREEVRELFVAKGFEGDLLERAVDTVCSNKDTWVAMMMSEEHALSEIDQRTSIQSSGIVGGASLIASVAPVIPFALVSNTNSRVGMGVAVVVGLTLLFSLGAFKARLTTGSATRSGAVLAVIGMMSAAAGYFVGLIVSR